MERQGKTEGEMSERGGKNREGRREGKVKIGIKK